MPNYVTMGPARNREDVVELIRPRPRRKNSLDQFKSGNAFQARQIDEVLQRRGTASVGVLCTESANDFERVLGHVNYLIDKGYATLLPRQAPAPKVKKAEPAPGKAPIRARKETRTEPSSVDELPPNVEFVEPAVCKVVANRYERDRDARKACLKAHGHKCMVCEMTFAEDYGDIGDGFIHVHHRTPRSLTKTAYKLNPITDLAPVCPNCHAMLHYGRPWDSPRSVAELRRIMLQRSSQGAN